MKLKTLLKIVDTDKYNVHIQLLDGNVKIKDFYIIDDKEFDDYDVVSIAPALDTQDGLELIVEIKKDDVEK